MTRDTFKVTDAVAALPGQWREAHYYSGVDPEEVAREHADELEAALVQDRESQAAAQSAPVGVEGLREIYSAVIRALAAIVTTGGSDKIEELGAIPRSPVMDQVAAIRGQMDKLSAIAQQPGGSDNG